MQLVLSFAPVLKATLGSSCRSDPQQEVYLRACACCAAVVEPFQGLQCMFPDFDSVWGYQKLSKVVQAGPERSPNLHEMFSTPSRTEAARLLHAVRCVVGLLREITLTFAETGIIRKKEYPSW